MNLVKLQVTKLIYRNLLHFYTLTTKNTNNKKYEREIQEAILFTTALKRVKYLRINLPKKTKDLYSKNYKMLMTQTDGEMYHVLGLKESILSK